ncbi:MAG: DUF255 domain-containing protein [Bacteroidota bacterium]
MDNSSINQKIRISYRSILDKIHLVIILMLLPIGLVRANSVDFIDLSVKEAKRKALQEQKFIFVDVFAEWCRPCKVMEKEVFADDSIGTYLNEHFVAIRIDAEREEQAFINQMKIDAYPTMLFYNTKGRLIYKHVGRLTKSEFSKLAADMVNLSAYREAYTSKPGNVERVANYASALEWTNQNRASQIARKYINNLPEKRYVKAENWNLIKEHVRAKDRTLFEKVLKDAALLETYSSAFKSYLRSALSELLEESVQAKSVTYLNRYVRYIESNPSLFSNTDSLVLAGKLAFAEHHQTPDFPDLFIEYMDAYQPKTPEAKAQTATFLAQKYFQKDVLGYGIKLADESIAKRPGAQAYFAKALSFDKLNQFKNAYANLLLAYQYADEEMTKALDQYETQLKQKMEYELREGVNLVEEKQTSQDGRFTLGAGQKRLMYGYPVPKSTSHFIINIDGKLASNAKHFKGRDIKYLTGKMTYEGAGGTPKVSITFEVDKVSITQRLTPVDKEGREITSGFAQYYQVSYQVKNLERKTKNVGLALLFDTMIDDNDYCVIAKDGKRLIKTESKFTKAAIPKELLFYQTERDTSAMMGAAIIKGLRATPPDELIVGRWPMLHDVTWAYQPQKVPYGDSAYLMKWLKRTLGNRKTLTFTTYYGLPAHKSPELRIVMEGETYLTKTMNIYFEHESTKLDLNAKMNLDELLNDSTVLITGALLNGYTDVKGQTGYNFTLSNKRIAAVGKIFKANGIAFVPKPYGLEQSSSSDYDKQYGNAWDRRVEVVVYYKLKNHNSTASR